MNAFRHLAPLAAVLFLAGIAAAAEPVTDPEAETQQALAAANARIAELERQVNSLTGMLGQQTTLRQVQARVDVLTKKVDRLDALAMANLETLDQVAANVQQVRQRDLVTLQDELQKIKGVRETSDRVDKTPREGLLTVDNLTPYWRTLSINDKPFTLAPGRTSVWVPYGSVTTHLSAYEQPKTWDTTYWKSNGRHQEMVIEIR